MFAKERYDKISALLRQNGAVSTASLMERFNVSIETIRRDLLHMEQQGLLSRVHGGAVALSGMAPLAPLSCRNEMNGELKRELSSTATKFVNEGDFIAVDSGSTAIFFAEALKERFSSLTVVTHSADVFELLRSHANFTVILSGGHYMQSENAFYGTLALDTIGALHMQKAFIFPAAISVKSGIYDYNQDLISVQRKLIDCSERIFILADSSKFEAKAPLRLSENKPEYTFVTDSALAPELATLYADNGFNIERKVLA